ncbi:MAG TPA: glucose 1-dehydrogenase [Pyrinomonadaceae bacterium]|nr:glucose 1-dehydrogenase [Acidobacteriota bacterium]HQZ97710.1 glucose 1-dehydrogenase [Pyrinomonadaceae bacterium]
MQGKVVIITGASSGIGRASALLFANRGATVVAVGRNEKELVSLGKSVKSKNGSIKPHLADMTQMSQLERIASETVFNHGQIDVLVNSAGIIMNGTIETTTLDEWDKMFQINLRSVFVLTQKCLPHLIETKGNIVNVSSVAGSRSFPNILAYGVSKAALDQMTRCSALELAPKGVRVNAVNPGVVVTNLHKRGGMDEKAYDAFIERSKETHPIGRAGTPQEVAELIYFLASEKASWITGSTYQIDGGRAQTCAR